MADAGTYAGDIIRSKREAKRMSQRDLAHKIGYSQSAVSQFEKGHEIPPATLDKIASALDIGREILAMAPMWGQHEAAECQPALRYLSEFLGQKKEATYDIWLLGLDNLYNRNSSIGYTNHLVEGVNTKHHKLLTEHIADRSAKGQDVHVPFALDKLTLPLLQNLMQDFMGWAGNLAKEAVTGHGKINIYATGIFEPHDNIMKAYKEWHILAEPWKDVISLHPYVKQSDIAVLASDNLRNLYGRMESNTITLLCESRKIFSPCIACVRHEPLWQLPTPNLVTNASQSPRADWLWLSTDDATRLGEMTRKFAGAVERLEPSPSPPVGAKQVFSPPPGGPH